MTKIRAHFVLLIVSIFFVSGWMFPVTAQLVSIQPDGKVATAYQNAQGGYDSIYVFNQTPTTQKAHLKVTASAPSTIEWYRYDLYNQTFGAPFHTSLLSTESQIDTLSQGGYRVVITNPDTTITCTAWAFLNPGFDLSLEKDDSGNVPLGHKTCSRTDLFLDPSRAFEPGRLIYRNPETGSLLLYTVPVSFYIRAGENEESGVTLRTEGTDQYFRLTELPYSNTLYTLRARDAFGLEETDQITYTPIVPNADMRAEYEETSGYRSAELEVTFVNESLNASAFVWYFGDGDTLATASTLPVTHSYFAPRTYRAKLVALSTFPCERSHEVSITVDPSRLDVANVFSPNNDGINDYFKPLNVSIRKYRISVFDRSGQKVFGASGVNMKDWAGWDGKADQGGDAPAGVYYYTLEAESWDTPAKKYQGKQFTGFFHLYR